MPVHHVSPEGGSTVVLKEGRLRGEGRECGEGVSNELRSARRSCFGDDWIVFERIGGDSISAAHVAELADAMRGGLLKYADVPAPSVITGHGEDGRRLAQTHLAFVPVPYVGSKLAKGEVLGVALVLPREVTDEERQTVVACIRRWEKAVKSDGDEEASRLELMLGRNGKLEVRRIVRPEMSGFVFRPRTWCRASWVWATVTPMALDRNPGDLHAKDERKRARAFEAAEETVAEACAHAELPRPAYVRVTREALLPGTPSLREYPPFPKERSRCQRVLVHARLVFDEEVSGPVIIGAGRFLGLGLCRPLHVES